MATIEEAGEKLKQWRWQQGWAEPYTCPQCGSGKLEGEGIGEPCELPDPEHEGEVLEAWGVVRLTCTVCHHQWIEGEPSEAEKMQQAGWPDLLADNGHGASENDDP